MYKIVEFPFKAQNAVIPDETVQFVWTHEPY